jgi:hypothetical protein
MKRAPGGVATTSTASSEPGEYGDNGDGTRYYAFVATSYGSWKESRSARSDP